MDSLLSNSTEKDKTKSKLIEFLEQNDIAYNIHECYGSERFCVDFSSEKCTCKDKCCKSEFIVQTSNKDIRKVYSCEILYIAIENRKSVLYLTSGIIETNYQLEHWKDILALKTFAQPHYSFIVNLNYVDEVTKKFVKVKYGTQEHLVYTSIRKIGAFKKAFLEFNEK